MALPTSLRTSAHTGVAIPSIVKAIPHLAVGDYYVKPLLIYFYIYISLKVNV